MRTVRSYAKKQEDKKRQDELEEFRIKHGDDDFDMLTQMVKRHYCNDDLVLTVELLERAMTEQWKKGFMKGVRHWGMELFELGTQFAETLYPDVEYEYDVDAYIEDRKIVEEMEKRGTLDLDHATTYKPTYENFIGLARTMNGVLHQELDPCMLSIAGEACLTSFDAYFEVAKKHGGNGAWECPACRLVTNQLVEIAMVMMRVCRIVSDAAWGVLPAVQTGVRDRKGGSLAIL